MSFLKGLIDTIEGGSGDHRHQNVPQSQPHGSWPHEDSTN
ncbi:unnamed protein product, partial [Rotaria sp. Silwood2]